MRRTLATDLPDATAALRPAVRHGGRWRTVEDWLAAHAEDPGAPEIRAQHERSRRAYAGHRRELLGWAIFVGRKI
jgi:hypothetical protein